MQKGFEFLTFIFALPHDDSIVWEIRKSTSLLFQLLKIEAIQTSLFVDVSDVLDIVLFEMSQRRSQNLPLDDSLTSSSLNNLLTLSRAFERLY